VRSSFAADPQVPPAGLTAKTVDAASRIGELLVAASPEAAASRTRLAHKERIRELGVTLDAAIAQIAPTLERLNKELNGRISLTTPQDQGFPSTDQLLEWWEGNDSIREQLATADSVERSSPFCVVASADASIARAGIAVLFMTTVSGSHLTPTVVPLLVRSGNQPDFRVLDFAVRAFESIGVRSPGASRQAGRVGNERAQFGLSLIGRYLELVADGLSLETPASWKDLQ
jgi:hypothetical protein